MKKLLTIILIFSVLPIFSQEKDDHKPVRGFSQEIDAREVFIEAEYRYLYENFDRALELYLQIYKRDSTNANLNYRIGQSMLHLTNERKYRKKDAIPFLEKSIEDMTSDYNEGSYKERKAPYEALFYLGNAYRFNHEFEKAIVIYERFISYLPPTDYFYIDYVKRESQACHNAEELISVPVKYDTESLNDIINSGRTVENCPVVNYNEDVIIYTSGRNNSFSPDIDMSAMNVDYKMDQIYFTHFVDSTWTEPVAINNQLKSGKTAVPTAITGDGKTLYIVRDDNDNGNIYVSNYENGKWSKMRKLNKKINSSDWESHASVTKDGKTLFFTSDRPGGYGGLDIYKSEIDEETGDWGEPINLGPTINSVYDEETPYIINDGKILYFSSQGHYGMGGFDIFYSSLLDNGKWTSPMNLGYPLNTVGNDLFYLPRSNGEYAIFPLNGNDRGYEQQNDIYKIRVPVPGNDSTEIEFKGVVSIEDNNWPMYSGAKITIINNDTQDTIEYLDIDLETGKYNTIISAGNFKVVYFAP
jgi:tetratricopeptide (TPR) repeat protein